MCFLVAVYTITSIVFLLQVNQYTQDIYDFPYLVSSQARIMKSRLYDFRSLTPVLFSSKDLNSAQLESALKTQEALQQQSITIIEDRYRGSPEELQELKDALKNIGQRRRELVELTREDPTVENVIKRYNQIVEPAFIHFDDILDRIASNADQRGSDINDKSDRNIYGFVIGTIIMGILLLWFIYTGSKDLNRAYVKGLKRDKLLKLLYANVDDVFIIFNEKKEPEYVSDNSLRILGFDPDAITNNKEELLNRFYDEDRNWLRNILNDRTIIKTATRNIELKGSSQTFQLSVYPVRQGLIDWTVVSLFDETEQIAYQRNLADALTTAKNASQAKSDFLSHMSHEIRTPMNAIIGMTTIALSRIGDKQKVEDCLKKTLLASRHLLGLINDILDMSKIESNKLALSYEKFDLQETVHSIYNLIEPQAKEKGVSFEIITNDVNQECLVGDQLRVNQVFINVIANAVKFTPRGGKVTMKLSEKQTSPEHIHLRCVISDNGIGMKKDFLSRVFLPFEQETAEIAQHFGGTGLGLAITHNLVNLMGGSIDVQSEEGKGSTFTIDLPFGISKDSAKHSESLLELRALVIDDDKDTCEHACVLLDQLGQKTEYALSGKEGIEKIKQAMQDNDPFDICFLDWKMPEMDGEATAREIRKIVGPETLIIIISAYDWSPIEGRAKEIGINGFIAKPFFSSSFYNWLSDPSIKENKSRDKDIVVQENTKKKRVLLAEDNEFNAEVAQDFLDMAGYTAEVVGDGAQAVKAFETHEPGYYSMIFMDIQMPVMNGLEAAQMIRSLLREDAHTIPIVAMTANAFSEDVSKSLNAGMNDHISKPIDLKKLHAVLGKYGGRNEKTANE